MNIPQALFNLADQTTGDESQALARLALLFDAGMAEALNHVLGEMIAQVCEKYDEGVIND